MILLMAGDHDTCDCGCMASCVAAFPVSDALAETVSMFKASYLRFTKVYEPLATNLAYCWHASI